MSTDHTDYIKHISRDWDVADMSPADHVEACSQFLIDSGWLTDDEADDKDKEIETLEEQVKELEEQVKELEATASETGTEEGS